LQHGEERREIMSVYGSLFESCESIANHVHAVDSLPCRRLFLADLNKNFQKKNEKTNDIVNKKHSVQRTVQRRLDVRRSVESKLGPFVADIDTVETLNRFRATYNVVEPALIIGNAPTLPLFKLGESRELKTFGSNMVFKAKEVMNWEPDFYVATDWLVGPNSLQEAPENFDPFFFLPLRFRGVSTPAQYVHWFGMSHLKTAGMVSPEDYSQVGFPSGQTVATTCISLAAFLGHKEIVLLGVDLTYKNASDSCDNVRSYATHEDQDHFIPNYYSIGSKWHNPNAALMAESLRLQSSLLEKFGVKIYNGSPFESFNPLPKIDCPVGLREIAEYDAP